MAAADMIASIEIDSGFARMGRGLGGTRRGSSGIVGRR